MSGRMFKGYQHVSFQFLTVFKFDSHYCLRHRKGAIQSDSFLIGLLSLNYVFFKQTICYILTTL